MECRDADAAYQQAIGHPHTTLLTIAAARSELAAVVDSLQTVKGVVLVTTHPAIGMARVLIDCAITSEGALLDAVRAICSNSHT